MNRAARRRRRRTLQAGGRIQCASIHEAARVLLDLDGLGVHVSVLHDDACSPARCVCQPEYVLQLLTAENYVAGERAESAWRKAACS